MTNEEIIRQIRDDGGMTIDWRNRKNIEADDAWYFPLCPDETIIVEDDSLLFSLRTFTSKHEAKLLASDTYLGIWRDPETGKYHFDVTVRVKETDEAIEKASDISAKSSYQIKSIYNIRRDKEITIGK